MSRNYSESSNEYIEKIQKSDKIVKLLESDVEFAVTSLLKQYHMEKKSNVKRNSFGETEQFTSLQKYYLNGSDQFKQLIKELLNIVTDN